MPLDSTLAHILQNLNPVLDEQEYVFCTVKEDSSVAITSGLCCFFEEEGVTVVLEKIKAEELSIPFKFTWKRITLGIHTELTAVGVIAALTSRLSAHDICVNVVSAYYHDHLFVLSSQAKKTIEILQSFSSA